jgi:hypothetical protein
MIDDQYTDPAVIWQQYRFGFASTADADTNALSTAAGASGGSSGAGGGGIIDTGGGGGTYDPPPCFIGSTPILMSDRDEVPIENVEVGMEVLAFDTEGRLVPAKVLQIFRHTVDEYLYVEFSDGRNTGVTGNHLYWAGGKVFKAIESLEYSLKLTHEDRWTRCRIRIKERIKESVMVYNLEIDIYKTYIANGDGVHNAKRIDFNQ